MTKITHSNLASVMTRVVAVTIKDSKISSPTGTVKNPLKSGRSSHGAKDEFKWTIWQNGGRKDWANSMFPSVRASLGPEDVLVSLSRLCLSVGCDLWEISVITEPNAAAFRVRWSTDMSHHLWPTVLQNITGIFHMFLISSEVVQVTFWWQPGAAVNCCPLRDTGRFWVKWEAN